MNNLIICPVGIPLSFDDRFEKENHWRYVDNERLYETMVVQYGSYIPEEKTYDILIQKKGHKFQLAKMILNSLDYSKYEYIGFLDDDLIIDYQSINNSILLAKENNLKLFQLSVTSDSDVFYPILRHNSSLKYAVTNFIEVMGPFIHTSLIPICLDIWNRYDIVSSWGFDKVLCDATKENAHVIHEFQMKHPKRNSTYDKNSAFAEMNYFLSSVFPKFMLEKYNEKWTFNDVQKNIKVITKEV